MKKSKTFLKAALLSAMMVFATGLSQAQTTLHLKVFLEGPYLGNGVMKPLCDFITVNLHDTTGNHFNIIYSDTSVSLGINGTATVIIPAMYTSDYFFSIGYRNHILTFSANPVSFTGGVINYDFTTDSTQACGNTLRNVNGVYVIYAGDITDMSYDYLSGTAAQDLVVDMSDVLYVFDSYSNSDSGCLITDINHDGMIDLLDVYMVYNNNFVYMSSCY